MNKVRWVLLVIVSVVMPALAADTNQVDELVRKSREALRQRQREEAMRLANQAVELGPTNVNALFLRGRIFAINDKSREAIADFNAALKIDPKALGVYQERGTEHFRLGKISESLADFDKFLDLAPHQAAHHWQRGIALYYAGKYAEGRKQFELHQTVNPNDVENAVWHYLCVAKMKGVDAAQAALLPIRNDARVPMMEIYALYAGKSSAASVLETAGRSDRDAQFYAHLYLALYYDAHKDAAKEREHIRNATEQYAMSHYMGAVARVHRQLRKL